MSSVDGSSLLDPAVGTLPTIVVSVGPHCESPELRHLARNLCVGLCGAGFHAVDVSNTRVASTTYTTAFPDSDLTTLYGMSQADLRAMSQRLKDRTEIFIPVIDLSMFTFEESLYVLYYALRHACLHGGPVVLPIVDASFVRLTTVLSRSWNPNGGNLNTSQPVQQVEMSPEQSAAAELAANYLRGTFVEEAIQSVLPWLFQSSFFLTTDLSVAEITTKVVNFATDLVQQEDGGPADEAIGQLLSETVWDSYKRAYAMISDKRPNSVVSKILIKLSSGGAVACNALRELDLSNCMMGDAGVQALAAMIRKLPSIVILSCAGNNIRDVGCHALAAHIGDHPSIESLNISDNKITDAGVTSLYFMLEGSSGVLNVDFTNNLNTSTVWMKRVTAMLERNRILSRAQEGASSVMPLESKRRRCIVNTFRDCPAPSNDNPTTMTLTMNASTAVDGTVGGVHFACRLDGFAAERASSIAGARSAQQQQQPQTPRTSEVTGNLQRPSLELEFSLDDPVAPQPSASSASSPPIRHMWSSQLLLQAGITSSVMFATSTMLLNLTRLNGQKLPVLYNAQRLDALCDDDGSQRANSTKALRSWADVASLLLTTTTDERRSIALPSNKELMSWSPAPTYEVLLLLTLDVLVNTQRNIFATALRSLIKTQPSFRVELRMVLDGNTAAAADEDDAAVESAAALMKASLTRPLAAKADNNSISTTKAAVMTRESFFTETSFLVLLKLRGEGDTSSLSAAGASATTSALSGGTAPVVVGRLNRPVLTGDVGFHVIGASSTQYYRPVITRCAGNVSSEITALLKWMLKQTNEPEGLEHLRQGELEDQARVDAHESGLKFRITTKWSGA
ncbi:Hypothetical protein, putative [Bodo saltans]|uniref:Leucine-rich repeat protein n=1 Tax=Bodo saltans TaxID=75058 RepID=A0A0S4IR70_BODSA|nr:Hypothetical protein, putative [Bodo saltans]|eukprot:CUG00750.1 Hypothetical protein, putative [Bodo saltans]